MKVPVSTYRIQLHSDFTLEDLGEILEYLHELEISTIYASPVFKARQGSTHGYDVLDPYTINPEIGNLEQFRKIIEILKQKHMNWLQDIVPNHMAFDGGNPWLRDIFELGPESEHYRYFDINWKESGKLMAPFLGASLEEVLENKELQIKFHEDGFSWNYYSHNYPLSAQSYPSILESAGERNWLGKFGNFSGNDIQWEDLKTGFFREVRGNMGLRDQIKSALEEINSSSDRIKAILDLQFFRPVHWKKTEEEINYRRFFTINDLICLRAEDQKVLESYHYYVKELCEQGLISGLRIDHIDGLFNPAGYLRELRKFIDPELYIVVEKIQEAEEEVPADWPTQGSTGYDFLAQVNQLFTMKASDAEFSRAYGEIAPEFSDYSALVFKKKLFVLKEKMGGELDNLVNQLQTNDLLPEEGKDTGADYKEALAVFLASFPVYRIYPEAFPLSSAEKRILQTTYDTAVKNSGDREKELEYLRSLFLGEAEKDREKMLEFLRRSQQFTGPLAAKGVEDTAFYIYNRLISHNEVGDSPGIFGINAESFHEKMQQRQAGFPLSLNATATHDTKRGEDARMRINVLSELPGEWFEKVKEWQQLNASLKKKPGVPDANEEYFIYQSILGSFPFEKEEVREFIPRLKEYLQKALREAKLHTSWAEPDEYYETAVLDFAQAIPEQKEFLNSFKAFREKVAYYGAIKSLGQTLIKVTAPGIPDVYQGTEFWDLSFVDPDNRRPVDYNSRKTILTEFKHFEVYNLKNNLKELKANYQDGKIKMYLLYKALELRKAYQDLFIKGEYIPLKITGENAEKMIAFARNLNNKWAVVIVPIFVTTIFEPEDFKPIEGAFSSIRISLPDNAPEKWKSCISNSEHSRSPFLNLQGLLEEFPVVLLSNLE